MKNSIFKHITNVFILATILGSSASTYALTTDIANSPLSAGASAVVKPNVMFILDDSGSMSFGYLPDSTASRTLFPTRLCYRNSSYNRIYYDPNTIYTPPVDSAGTPYANASFTAAYNNGLIPANPKTDLSSSFKAWDTGNHWGYDVSGYWDNGSDAAQAAYYYKHNATPTVGTCHANAQYTKITVSSTSGPGATDERTNFANWYSYYRSRMLSMKTSAGLAFKNIKDDYRIGYTTISYTGVDSANSEFHKINDYNYVGDGTGQKEKWYTKLYAAVPSGGTPLRAALSKVGRMYAGKLLTGVNDPVQYSCQQNFAILSTDGYWNGAAGYKIDGTTAVGDTDSNLTISPRPMYDKLASSNALSDVARYYYNTDLRSSGDTGALGTDVSEDNVPDSGLDTQPQQHMTTFTLGLGVNGTLGYAEDYLSNGSTDFNSITAGTKNWPVPVADTSTAVDDLWHAAVNGRGAYFSAQNPTSLQSGIGKALAGVKARTGAASAAATSNLQPVSGDNFAYLALYRTVFWDGDLQKKEIDPGLGTISTTTSWSAQPLLDAVPYATRKIYTSPITGSTPRDFTYANLTVPEIAYFDNICTGSKLSQCATLTGSELTFMTGTNLVNFIRGDDSFEDQASNTLNKLYRDRQHVLGDMINSQPVYLKAPALDYVDTNYDTYKNTTQKNRAAMVYVAVNDGMLHAFDGGDGTEKWAYIPPLVMPELYRLADKNYASNHRFSVDGSPTIADVCLNAPISTCTGSQWKSMLVAGLNAGGRGYYALDVTDPANPKVLWNYTVANDPDLGYSFSSPVITKLKTGQWVVLVTSGYNNVSPGDGKGYLYVLDAATGTKLFKIQTGNVGDTTTPSGLGKINAWINSSTDNTAERVYGGDMLGNVWRFDINDIVPPAGKEAILLATLGNNQPITTRPELTLVSSAGIYYPIVVVGTGRYLGGSDLIDTNKQSIYAIKDNLSASGIGLARTPGTLVQQTLVQTSATSRTTVGTTVNWASDSGWYVDLDPSGQSPGERVNVQMLIQLGILVAVGNVPDTNACNSGGYAWLYSIDVQSGQYSESADANAAGTKIGNALVAGISQFMTTNGETRNLVTTTDGDTKSLKAVQSSGTPDLKRSSWRELIKK